MWIKNGGTAACFDMQGNRTWISQTHLQATDHPMNIPSPVLIDGVLVCEGGATPYWERTSKNRVPKDTLPGKIPGKTSSYPYRHWLVGLDAQTGKVLWDLGPLHAGGYGGPASPVAVRLQGDGASALVLTAEGHLVGRGRRQADRPVCRPEERLRVPVAGAGTVRRRRGWLGCQLH
jgi:hypothetical protein